MFNPPIADLHGAYDDLAALLKVLVDPTTHKARLDELIAQEAASKEQIAALNAMAAETRRLHSAAQATNIVSDNRKAALDVREAEIEQRANQLELSESTRADAALKRREAAVESRENAVKAELDRLAATRRDLETKLGKIKNLTSSLG
jgi:chromosome segregation ATPase